MTDAEQERIKAICKVARVDDISNLSDGYHTFKQLYYQRMMLFAVIVKQNRDKAWKSLRHEDGELCFGGGWFIVGIDTPEGSYTYHYEDNYFSLFDCEELERGKKWDGHTEKDVTRLLSLEQEPCDDAISREDALMCLTGEWTELTDEVIHKFIKRIKNLPPMVLPKQTKSCYKMCDRWQRMGRWKPYDGSWYECSECGAVREAVGFFENYCPNCGRKMEVDDE